MGKPQKPRQGRKNRRRARIVTWVAIAAVAAVVVYGVSQISGVAYNDDDIRVVNFSGLDAKQKNNVLEAANRARCSCGCGLGLAQCVSTDLTCPIRESNVDRIKSMVQEAMASPPSS